MNTLLLADRACNRSTSTEERRTPQGYMPAAKRQDWATPRDLFDALSIEFGPFDLDPCGSSDSYVSQRCGTFYDSGGLDRAWLGAVFVNPPYGLVLRDWTQKCRYETEYGVASGGASIVVALLPARTDTRWFHENVLPHASIIRFLKGRLTFEGAPAPAPFPSMIVVWGLSPGIEASPEFVAGSIERLSKGDDGLRESHELAKVGAIQEALL